MKLQKLRQVQSLLKTSASETSDIPGMINGPPMGAGGPLMIPQQVNGHLTGGPPMMHGVGAGPSIGYAPGKSEYFFFFDSEFFQNFSLF